MPHQFSEKQKSEFCAVLAVGCDRETACNYYGWSPAQLRHALEHDAEFAQQLQRAEALPEVAHMRHLHEAAKDPKNWRISVWWLERHAPERFAQRAPNTLTASQMKQIVEQLSDSIDDEITSEEDNLCITRRLEQIAGKLQIETFTDGEPQPIEESQTP